MRKDQVGSHLAQDRGGDARVQRAVACRRLTESPAGWVNVAPESGVPGFGRELIVISRAPFDCDRLSYGSRVCLLTG